MTRSGINSFCSTVNSCPCACACLCCYSYVIRIHLCILQYKLFFFFPSTPPPVTTIWLFFNTLCTYATVLTIYARSNYLCGAGVACGYWQHDWPTRLARNKDYVSQACKSNMQLMVGAFFTKRSGNLSTEILLPTNSTI